MVEKSFVLPLATLPDALSIIEHMTDDQFQRLAVLVGTARSFSPPSKDMSDFANEMQIPQKDVQALTSALHFLYDRLSDLPLDDQSRHTAIIQAAGEILDDEPATHDRLTNRLGRLLAKSEMHDRFKKLFRLERGFLPNAVLFESFVDMRPDFSEDLSTINGYIPIISFNIRTNSTNPTQRNFNFNVPLDKIDDFVKAVERMTTKISRVRGSSGL